MKKMMFFGMALMLSFAVCGLSMAEDGKDSRIIIAVAAGDQVKTEYIDIVGEKITVREFSIPKQSEKSIDGDLLAVKGGCSPDVISLCQALYNCCCNCSPDDPCAASCTTFESTCAKCGISCTP